MEAIFCKIERKSIVDSGDLSQVLPVLLLTLLGILSFN